MFNMRFIVSCNLVDYNEYISTSFLYARCLFGVNRCVGQRGYIQSHHVYPI